MNTPVVHHQRPRNVFQGKEIVKVSQDGRWREIIVPSKEKIVYPAVWSRSDYERIKQKALVTSSEEKLKLAELKEVEYKKKLQAIDDRTFKLKEQKRVQPEDEDENICDIPKVDTSVFTLKRSSELKSEALQGPRIANQIILASKCHAIRDVQLQEKALIKKEIEADDKRLDHLMDEARKAAIQVEEKRQHSLKARRIENIQEIKRQIQEKERLRLLETKKSKVEGKIIVQSAIILNQEFEAEKKRKKIENKHRLREVLDIGNYEMNKNKEMQKEREVILNKRIEEFLKQRKERETRLKQEAEAVKLAQEKEKIIMAQAQESEKKFHEEIENLRILKVQEDVEREFRKREKDAAVKKAKALEELRKAREKQISDIRNQMAMELVKDEQVYEGVKQKLQEDKEKDEKMKSLRQQSVEAYRKTLLEQISEKESKRLESKEQSKKEGVTWRVELERKDEMEKTIIRNKIKELREQKIPEPYVIEVEQRLKKMNYY